jgi:hypothetical protein
LHRPRKLDHASPTTNPSTTNNAGTTVEERRFSAT